MGQVFVWKVYKNGLVYYQHLKEHLSSSPLEKYIIVSTIQSFKIKKLPPLLHV